jgi:hypothetical protein
MLCLPGAGANSLPKPATGPGAAAQEARDARAIESDLKRFRQLLLLRVRDRSRNRATVSTALDLPDSSY